VRTFRAFLEFYHFVRQDAITEDDLSEIRDAVIQFHEYREIFITTGVRSHFLLPRQHSMVHYHSLIQQFGAPNGLCSSITESKHIRAVKEPWRRSNRYEALGQMLVTNQRLDQLMAARTDFANRGMLNGTCLSEVLQALGELLSDGLVIFSLFLMQFIEDSEPLSLDTATGIQDDDNASRTILEEARPDENINEEIVDDPNVLAEVTLPSRICQLQLFQVVYHDFPKRFVQIKDGLSTMLRSSFSNPCSQC
jgi:hypothetical protein